MPAEARANGAWRGPDPKVLQDLSYTESKVINLARVYVSVKRVFLEGASYAGTSRSESPWYHQKNVVACCSPEMLARTILVQFVGGEREALRSYPDLRVPVPKLRAAFKWLSVNCWPFMEATKEHTTWDQDTLDLPFEELLASYISSMEGETEGFASEGRPVRFDV